MRTRTHLLRQGFTLIELLVVIAIIAILAAILFPVFARARENARRVTCTSNCRQIGTALMMYAQDYDETLPGWPGPNGTPGNPIWKAGYKWAMIVLVLDPYTKSRAIWVCPSGQKTVYTGTNNDQIAMNLGYSEYFYNTANSVVPYRNWTSLAALTGSTAGVAKIALVADSRASGASAVAGIFNDWGDRDGFCFPNEGKDFGLGRLKYANDWTGTCPATPGGERHPGYGANVVFADGHAQFINGGAMRGHGTIGNDGSIGGITEWPVVNPLNLPPS